VLKLDEKSLDYLNGYAYALHGKDFPNAEHREGWIDGKRDRNLMSPDQIKEVLNQIQVEYIALLDGEKLEG
jgi:hypothetical protein